MTAFTESEWKRVEHPRRYQLVRSVNSKLINSVLVLETIGPDIQKVPDVDVFLTSYGIVVESFHKFNGELRYSL